MAVHSTGFLNPDCVEAASHGGRFENIDLPDAELRLATAFLRPSESAALFAELRRAIAWEQHRIRMFGRWIDSPRRSCWIGDPGTAYTYSGARFEPRAWPIELLELRRQIESACATPFNSVLANFYRSGADSMGYHADDEPELGDTPTIASLSLGASRRFLLRHRRHAELRRSLELPPGSLLVMRGPTQQNWLHALPKTQRKVGERINLTFRWIGPHPLDCSSADPAAPSERKSKAS